MITGTHPTIPHSPSAKRAWQILTQWILAWLRAANLKQKRFSREWPHELMQGSLRVDCSSLTEEPVKASPLTVTPITVTLWLQ